MTRLIVEIDWAATAIESMKALPKKVRAGLIAKVDRLVDSDPTACHKPLVGPLQGCYRITYGRYRLIYQAIKSASSDSDDRVFVRVTVVFAGIRKEQSREDVYQLSRRILPRPSTSSETPPDTGKPN